MARFKRARPADTVRADWWDADEHATFRPQLSGALGVEMAMVLEPLQAELREKAAARGISEALLASLTERLTVLCTLFVALEGWTFRAEPTPAQAAAGEPGHPVPIAPETLEQLEPRDLAFLIAELGARIGGDFRPAAAAQPDPGGSGAAAGLPVPAGRRVRGRGRAPGAGHRADGDGLPPLPVPAE